MSNLIVFHDDGVIQLNEVRLSYPNLWVPRASTLPPSPGGKPQPPKYSCEFILPKATHKEVIKLLHAKITELAKEALKGLLPADRYCLRDGNLKIRPEIKDCWTINVSETTKPKVVDRLGNPLADDSSLIYPGVWVNGYLRLWAQNNAPDRGGKRINANLLGVQYVRPGERLGAERPDVTPLFEDLGPGEVVEMGAEDFDL